jgi:hypothetical protein
LPGRPIAILTILTFRAAHVVPARLLKQETTWYCPGAIVLLTRAPAKTDFRPCGAIPATLRRPIK